MSTCGRSVGLCTAPSAGTAKAPVPGGGRGPGVAAFLPEGREIVDQRQRIDMTRPATMAPKPMAKFQAPSDTMIGMRSPAT